MRSATPARSALARAASMAPASRSVATMRGIPDPSGTAAASRRRAASAPTLAHVPGSNDGQSHRARCRSAAAGTPAASSAASMAMVPDPHIGSTRGAEGSHPAEASRPAATDSRSGALAVACLQPRSWRGAPEESTLTVNRSSTPRTTTSGWATSPIPPSSKPFPPVSGKAAANRSATAPPCHSFECRVVTRNRGAASAGSHGDQSMAAIRRSRSANVRTVNRSARTRILVAQRRNRLAA